MVLGPSTHPSTPNVSCENPPKYLLPPTLTQKNLNIFPRSHEIKNSLSPQIISNFRNGQGAVPQIGEKKDKKYTPKVPSLETSLNPHPKKACFMLRVLPWTPKIAAYFLEKNTCHRTPRCQLWEVWPKPLHLYRVWEEWCPSTLPNSSS